MMMNVEKGSMDDPFNELVHQFFVKKLLRSFIKHVKY